MDILIVDTCHAYCDGLASWLQPAGFEVTSYCNTEDFSLTMRSDQFKLVIFGPSLPSHTVFASCRELLGQRNGNGVKIIFASLHADDLVFQCDAAFIGVSACFAVNTSQQIFVDAVKGILQGSSYIPQDILAQAFLPINLTQAELDVLRLMADGKTDLEIAKALGKAHNTVRTQTKFVLEKLQVNTRAKAIYRARHRGLI